MSAFREEDVVVNVVWVGPDFDYLRYFVASQVGHCRARYRHVVNGCPPATIDEMRRAAAADDRIEEVLVVSEDQVEAHGVALDRVRAERDDGPVFAFADPDIIAVGPFLDVLLRELEDAASASSASESWMVGGENVVPDDHPGVAGEHVYGVDGFVYGSPHLAVYRRDELEATAARWGVGLGSAGPELDEEVHAAIESMDRRRVVFDTGKVANALLQADGHRVAYRDIDSLLHIGGMSYFLQCLDELPDGSDEHDVDWSRWGPSTARERLARYTVGLLRWHLDAHPEPSPPPEEDEALLARYRLTEERVAAMVEGFVPTERRRGPGAAGGTQGGREE